MKNFLKSLMFVALFSWVGACKDNSKSTTHQSYHNEEAVVEHAGFAVDVESEAEMRVDKSDSEVRADKQEIWLKSLLTDTPQEGRELAIQMARKSIAAIQTDPEVRKRLRDDFAEDTRQLISSAHVIAIEFQTIASANNYWKDKK